MFDFGLIKTYLIHHFMKSARPDANMSILSDKIEQTATSLTQGRRRNSGNGAVTSDGLQATDSGPHPIRQPARIRTDNGTPSGETLPTTRGRGNRRGNHGPS